MRRPTRWALAIGVAAAVSRLSAQSPPSDPGIKALTEAVARLASALERQAAQQAEEREARRVDVAASILALRYRKIERLDAEADAIDRDEESSRASLEMMKKQIEQFEQQSRNESGQIPAEAKLAVEQMQLQIKLEDDRLAKQRERAALVLSEAEGERRRLAGLEAILEDWLQRQAGPR